MTTWGQIHVGDTVRGADQRVWTVTYRGAVNSWVVAGGHCRFTFKLGDREVSAWRRLAEPVELVERADHSGEAAAYGALSDAFGEIKIMEESTVDQFTAPAPDVEPKFDRWKRYLLPDPQSGVERAWTRVSTVARTLADEFGLTQWKQRMVAKGMALRPDLIAGASAADPESDKSTLNDIAQQAFDFAESRKGANLGTAVHTFAQRLDRGEALESMRVPAPLDRDLAAYAELMRTARLRIEQSERVVIIPALGVAGRFDRIVTQQPGVTKSEPRSVLDLKSGKDLDYSWLEIAIQQALYAHATLMWVPATNTYEPMPVVDKSRALVVHMPVGKATAQLYGINIIEGWRLAQLAMDVRAARSGAKSLAWVFQPDDPATVALHRVSNAASREELAALWEELYRRGLWSAEVEAAAMAQYEQIKVAIGG